jgi:hypothetical protein
VPGKKRLARRAHDVHPLEAASLYSSSSPPEDRSSITVSYPSNGKLLRGRTRGSGNGDLGLEIGVSTAYYVLRVI